MDRRAYLVVVAGLLGAGCTQRRDSGPGSGGALGGVTPTVILDMTPVSDGEIARRVTYGLDDGPESKRRLAERIVTTGSATVEAEEPPLKNVDRVLHDGSVYRITVARSNRQNGTEYRYTAAVIGSAEEIGASFRHDHQFGLSGLSNAELDIVQQAMSSDGYRVAPADEEPGAKPSDALKQLVTRFREHAETGFDPDGGESSPGVTGRYLVQHNGDTYYTVLEIDETEF